MTMQVAIDGPAGAGKSTVAYRVGNCLRLPYIDTGAMYRSVAWIALMQGISFQDERLLADIAENLALRFIPHQQGQVIKIGERDVTEELRTAEIGELAPIVAKLGLVRQSMLRKQQMLATSEPSGVVMDGRDIGTHVLPNADVKIYLTATLETRARRRFADLKRQGFTGTLAEVSGFLHERDEQDGRRAIAPMRPAKDAVILDSTSLSVNEVVDMIVALCRHRQAHKEEQS